MATISYMLGDRPDVLDKLRARCPNMYQPRHPSQASAPDLNRKTSAGSPTNDVAASASQREAKPQPLHDARQARSPLPAGTSTRQRKRAKAASALNVFPEVVYAARTLTQGKRLLVVGGIAKDADKRRIEEALQCEVEWCAAKHGENLASMEAAGLKCDLLVSIIRLLSHAHSASLADLSREYGIPLVRVQAGHNPSAIANDIAKQLLHKH